MNLIVCLDERNGMAFNHRRQSRDKKQRRHMLKMLKGMHLWISPYTARLMEEEVRQVPEIELTVSENFLQEAGKGDYVFAEREDLSSCLEQAEKLLVYRWNRHYPTDVSFPEHGFDSFAKESEENFAGSSHDRITFEVFTR